MVDYVHIATFTYPSDLTIAKSTLEANEIDCYIRDELTVQVHNYLSNAIGGIRLEVREKQYEQALKILIDSGFGNHISEDSKANAEFDNRNTNKFLNITIKIVLGVCLFWISLIIYFLFIFG